MIIKIDKLAAYVIIAFAAFQSWYAGMLDIRPQEAYLALKAFGVAWGSDPHGGLTDYVALMASWFSQDLLALRIPAVLMMSFAAVFVYKSAFMLGGKYAAWATLAVFFVSPAINIVYTFLSPAATLALFAAIAYYSWMRAFDEGSASRFAIAGFFSGVCLLTHYLGAVVFASAIFYILIFDRSVIRRREFVFALAVFLFFIVGIFGFTLLGYDILPGYSGVVHGGSIEYFVACILFSPALFYTVPFVLIMRNRLSGSAAFLISALIVSIFVCIVSFAVGGFDIKLCAPLFLPAVILCGYFLGESGGKAMFAVLLFCSAVLSAYIKIAPNMGWSILPVLSVKSEIYKSFADPIARGLSRGGAVMADDKGTASMLAYYVNPRPMACVPEKCGVGYGLYITSTKYDGLTQQPFPYMKMYGTYRIIDNGVAEAFYLYTVR